MSDERLDRIEAALQGLKGSYHDLAGSNQSLTQSYHKLTVLEEDTNSRVRLFAEGLAATSERMDRSFAEIGTRIDGTNQMMRTFIQQQAAANREFQDSQSDHEGRLQALGRRRKAR